MVEDVMKRSAYLAELVHAQLEGRKPKELPKDISMSELIGIAKQNHMEYLILGALLRLDNIGEDQKEEFRSTVKRSILKTMTQVTELRRIEECFEKAGIRNQVMKGARMKFIYPSPEMREMSDIDILVDVSQLQQAGNLLKENGYVLLRSVKHHDVYKKPPFTVVEVHRALYDKTVDGGQYRYFSSFTRSVLSTGKHYSYDFNREDFYVYMLAHMAKHFYTMGCGIRNLVDIYVYREKYGSELNTAYLERELRSCGILEFTRHMERLTDIWLKGEKGSPFYEDLFRYMLDCGVYGKDENGIWNRFSEKMQENKQITENTLKRWYYFPPLSYMSEYYPWLSGRAFLLPIAWGIRACRGIFMKKGEKKRNMLRKISAEEIKMYQAIYSNMGLHFKK